MRTEYIWEIGAGTNQEDYIIIPDNTSRIFILCDGMGGHGHGEIASKIVGDSVFKSLSAIITERIAPSDLQSAVNLAASRLKEADIFNDEKKMGTTIIIVVFNHDNILIGHIGDSRCYIFDKDFRIKYRSKDHSLVQEALDEEILTEEEAFEDPKRNIITRCISSGNENVKMDIDIIYEINESDNILICSDGIHDTLRDTDLSNLLASEGLDGVKSYCRSQAKDNFSAILLSDLQPITERKNDSFSILGHSSENQEYILKSISDISVDTTDNSGFNRYKTFIHGFILGILFGLTFSLIWDFFHPQPQIIKYVSKPTLDIYKERYDSCQLPFPALKEYGFYHIFKETNNINKLYTDSINH